MKKIKERQVILIISLLAGILLAYILFDGIFQYAELSELIDKPFFSKLQSTFPYFLVLVTIDVITIWFMYDLFKIRKKNGSIKYNKLLGTGIFQLLLELPYYFILFFLSSEVVGSYFRIFAWYNTYDYLRIAFYIYCIGLIIKAIMILLSFKIQEDSANKIIDNRKMKIIRLIGAFCYGGLIFIMFLIPSVLLKKEIEINIPLDDYSVFEGENGQGYTLFIYDYYKCFDDEYEIWEDEEDMNMVLAYRYLYRSEIEIISKNNGELSNGDTVEIKWNKDNKPIDYGIKIKANSNTASFIVKGLKTKVFIDELKDEQKATVNEKLNEYVESQAFIESVNQFKKTEDLDFKLVSMKQTSVISEEFLKDDLITKNNVLSVYENAYTNRGKSSDMKKGDATDYYIYEVILENPKTLEKKYYYVACEIQVVTDDIVEEQSFDKIEFNLYKVMIADAVQKDENLLEGEIENSYIEKDNVKLVLKSVNSEAEIIYFK
ncbi:hypothetical protein [Breznakia pachnodae]|uniref:Uncharacterized protein n=1 Tax=Breznakia pachnodae TaxID=265178 RepID=A0ABU0E2A1_9FIRM|nr:hypothetical protein [Breznakia pachnodae]MDQ0360846.1 hypothetical protein [Breznakia pachnodae]